MSDTTLHLARLLHHDRLAEAQTHRRARTALDHRRAGRLEARAARLRERAELRSPAWAPSRAVPATVR